MKNSVLWISVLFFINVCLAFVVVYAKHETRNSHIELSQLRAIEDDLNIEWSQLQLEEGTLSEYGLVEKIARERLRMHVPDAENIRLVVQ